MKAGNRIPDRALEDKYNACGFDIVAGTDEAGRGPLAGNVYAAACVLPRGIELSGLKDSKQLGIRARERLYDIITGSEISYSIAYATVDEIDSLNILNAAQLAMRRAVSTLDPAPSLVLVDGSIARNFPMPSVTVIGGDSISISIAAASVLAKVARDRYCMTLDLMYPEYGFKSHKGYPTKAHYEAISLYGVIDGVHRRSFRLHK